MGLMAWRTPHALVYHIPKCGGMWVEQAMRRGGLRLCYTSGIDRHPWDLRRQHATPQVVHPRYRRSKYEVCFVRRPLGWYRSFWAYRCESQKFNPRFPLDTYWDADFETFVGRVLDAFPGGFLTAMYAEFADACDYVGHQERLADDLVEALLLAGDHFDVDALRATPHANVVAARPAYRAQCEGTPALRQRIRDVEYGVWERYYA